MKSNSPHATVNHSKSKDRYNIKANQVGYPYLLATVPYAVVQDIAITQMNKKEAKEHAEFICWCFNNRHRITGD
jgi:hypothetical protein